MEAVSRRAILKSISVSHLEGEFQFDPGCCSVTSMEMLDKRSIKERQNQQ